MKKQKKSYSKNILIMSVIVFLLATIFAIFFINKNRSNNPNDSTTNKSSDSNIKLPESDTTNKVDYSPSKPSDNNAINDQKSGQNTTQPSSASFSATITNTRIVNSSAQVSVLINGASSGKCTLLLSKAGQTDVSKTVVVVVRNGITTCEDFNIPTASLSQGSWAAKITVLNESGKSATAESTLQVGQ